MTLFRLDASIRVEGSASREIADIVEQEWLAAHPGDRVERRVSPGPWRPGPPERHQWKRHARQAAHGKGHGAH